MTGARSPRPKLLIAISSMNMGGPQKSLVGLLQRLDPATSESTVVVLDGKSGPLRRHLPDHVRVVSPPIVVTAATLPRETFLHSLAVLLRHVRVGTAAGVIKDLVSGQLRRTGFQQIRQAVWKRVARELPGLNEHFDAAVGILGLSTYYVVDLVDAAHTYHWVRSDVRMLARDEGIDEMYYGRLTGAVAVSEECSRIFQDVFPLMRDNVVVYKNDIPTLDAEEEWQEELAGTPTSFRILTLARLDRLKGIDLAVGACRILREQGRNVSWVVLGDGPERARLEALIAEADLAEHFSLPGTTIDIGPHLRRADLYVHPSRFEGRSNAVEEARAAGVPLVATSYPTVASQVEHGVTGLVCELDAEALAAAVAQLMDDPGFAATLADTARARYDSERDDPVALVTRLTSGTSWGSASCG